MALCSQPECSNVSIGVVESLATRRPKPDAQTIAGQAVGHRPDVGEICLPHVMDWFPGKSEEWVANWLVRQGVEAAKIRDAEDQRVAQYKASKRGGRDASAQPGLQAPRRRGVFRR